jgi:NAD(P)-dependent dehydrogenase (short-subunit alcohol dehydrogenase family)
VIGTPAFSIYSATKAAIRNPARTWALDLKGTGIGVNVLSPGPITTELALEVLGEEGVASMGASTVLGRMGEPSETGAVAAFLASSDSSFMTGGEVFVDGWLAQPTPFRGRDDNGIDLSRVGLLQSNPRSRS